MDYEKKYKEALEWARRVIQGEVGFVRDEVLEKFPELKEIEESENERIRKDIVFYIAANHKDDGEKARWLYWLEKQGEQKPIAGSKFKVGDKVVHKGTGKLWTVHWYIKENNVYSVEDSEGLIHVYSPDVLELVEQNPAEKVKPKFKVGDWVVVDDGRTGRIIECTKDFADVDLEFSCLSTRVNNIRSWTIQDAKDGDILVHSSFMFGDFIFIYNNKSILQAYCYYSNESDRFIIEDKEHLCLWNMQEVKPTTKEQRDLLFAKMKEAGYEWDTEKKELKKIEQKPAWNEEDEKMFNETCGAVFAADYYSCDDKERIEDWLKALKERVQPQNTWKPSDEQMDAMQKALVDLCGKDEHNIITGLYYDLKKLKGE